MIKNNTQNHIDTHHKKMISLVDRIKPNCIIQKCVCSKALYYKISKIIDHCISPAVAYQNKTFELEYIGDNSVVSGISNRKIYYYAEILPYAQIIIKE